jgi:hypothetical protein
MKARRTGASPFAHLLSILPGAAKGGRAEDDPTEDLDAEDEDEDIDAEDADPNPDAADADEDETDTDAEDDAEDKPKDAKRAKGAKKAETDDDTEGKAEDEDDDEDMARARREGFLAAQARGRRIFSTASAGIRPDMAAHLAFNDEMPSANAIAMLDMAASATTDQPRKSTLHRRMSRVVLPKPGTGGAGGKGAKSEVDSFVELAAGAAKKAGLV